MTDKEQVENIVRGIAASFSGAESTKDWTEETLWFDAALVCSVQRWDTVNKDGSANPPFMMRQTDYLEKQGGVWKVLHEHTSMAQGWDGKIVE